MKFKSVQTAEEFCRQYERNYPVFDYEELIQDSNGRFEIALKWYAAEYEAAKKYLADKEGK